MMDPFTTDAAATLDRKTLRRAFLLAVIPGVILATKMAESAEVTVPGDDGEAWTIQINPRQSSATAPAPRQLAMQDNSPGDNVEEVTEPPEPPRPTQLPSEIGDQPVQNDAVVEVVEEPAPAPGDNFGIDIVPNSVFRVNGLTYQQVYDSIPYSRTEYLANPSYRHETAMELLTGVPRQTGINRQYEVQLNTPIAPQSEFLYNRYGTFGGTFGGGGGYGGFGYGNLYIPQYAPAFRYFLPLDFGF